MLPFETGLLGLSLKVHPMWVKVGLVQGQYVNMMPSHSKGIIIQIRFFFFWVNRFFVLFLYIYIYFTFRMDKKFNISKTRIQNLPHIRGKKATILRSIHQFALKTFTASRTHYLVVLDHRVLNLNGLNSRQLSPT